MPTEVNPEQEFIIPTRYKIQVSSHLSWPVGAKELTKHLADLPQIRELQLSFAPSYGAPQQGEWPATFRVIEIRYTHPPFVGDSDWQLNIYPVPRNARAEIRKALALLGFKRIVDWFLDHADFSGRESSLRFTGFWNSELNDLNFESHDNVLPKVSRKTGKQK